MKLLLLLIAAVVNHADLQSAKAAEIEDLAFMAGSWKAPMWGGTFEEHWTKPGGGTMVGTGRLVVGKSTEFMEFLSIEGTGGGLTMYIMLDAPSKGDKKPVPFRLTSVKGKTAVFENPQNDFPSKITYKAAGKDKMSCRISGTQNGKASHEDFNFVRMK